MSLVAEETSLARRVLLTDHDSIDQFPFSADVELLGTLSWRHQLSSELPSKRGNESFLGFSLRDGLGGDSSAKQHAGE